MGLFHQFKLKRSSIIIMLCLLALAIIAIVWASSYYSQQLFYLNQHTYKKESQRGHIVYYEARSGPAVEVRMYEENKRKVVIANEEHTIVAASSKDDMSYDTAYEIHYPNGQHYIVQDQAGHLMSYTESGQSMPDIFIYADNQRVMNKGEERYHPSWIVTIAYPEYHDTQGQPILFVVSLLLVAFGWCIFTYEKFQYFVFRTFGPGFWSSGYEPDDYHYFWCKLGGIISIVGAIPVFLKSL